MLQEVNSKYAEIFTTDARYIIIIGGRGAGRSYVASQYVLSRLIDTTRYFRCAIMRFVLGDIRNSIFQEIIDRTEEQEVRDNIKIKENSLTLQYAKNKINGIGFRRASGDQKSKLKSLASYNCVVIEEADEVAEDDFMQLDDSLRTINSDIKIIFLLNPPDKRHWIIRRFFNLVPSDVEGFYNIQLKPGLEDVLFIQTNYEDNALNLNSSTITNYERYKGTRPDYYYNMIKGMVSEGVRGRIFTNWLPIPDEDFDELPYDSVYGLDFGFSDDPLALSEVKEHNDTVWVKERIYQSGLTNPALSEKMDEIGIPRDALIIADSAEPKSIQELKDLGWNVVASVKGADSIRSGVNKMKSKQFYYTVSSTNIENEQQNYVWALDKNKEPTNKPTDKFNHAMDGIRYVITRVVEFIGFA